MPKKNSKYWQGRFDQIEQAANNKSVRYTRDLEKKYQTAAQQIDTQINAWYQRLADNNGVSMTEARKLLTNSELKEFKWTVEDYIKHGEQNALDQSWLKELENASAKFHINRLEALKLECRQQIEDAFGGGQQSMFNMLGDIYKDTFYRSCFEVQKGVGVGFDVSKLDDKKVTALLSKPWSVDGNNFSEKLWGNKRKLINNLDQELSRMVLTGESPKKAIQNIRKTMDSSLKVAKKLVMTEQAYFTTVAQKDAYKELDVEEFEVVETLDGKTCEVCGKWDGKPFPISELQPGVNAPPFHPFCRGTTCPYFDDEFVDGKRIAKDTEGNLYEVPENMTYKEWKKTFVDGGDKSDLIPVSDETKIRHVETSEVVKTPSEIATNSIIDAYKYRTEELGIGYVPYTPDNVADLKLEADFTGMSDNLAGTTAQQFADLCSEYDTTCQNIIVEKFDALRSSVPASTDVQMNIQTSKISFNKAVVGNYDKFESRMANAVERGQFPQMTEDMYDKYVITHEFAHTLMDFDSPVKNYVGAETKHISAARKEIRSIRQEYMDAVNTLEAKAKAAELKALETFDEADWKLAQDLRKQASEIRISKYADMSIDEFMAEAFTDAKIGSNTSEYSKRVLDVIDKYFKKQPLENVGKSYIMKLSNKEVREQYIDKVSKIKASIDSSLPMEEKAKLAFEARNNIRTEARKMMADEETRKKLDKEHPNKSFEELVESKMKRKGMTREEAIKDVFETATKTNADVNKELGLGGE